MLGAEFIGGDGECEQTELLLGNTNNLGGRYIHSQQLRGHLNGTFCNN